MPVIEAWCPGLNSYNDDDDDDDEKGSVDGDDEELSSSEPPGPGTILGMSHGLFHSILRTTPLLFTCLQVRKLRHR